jgi:glyoxylase-like metal-dependent hydrolase (beta-lactamase superfamily II)
LHPILTGEIRFPRAHIDRPSGPLARARTAAQVLGPRTHWIWLPVPAFLVEHPVVGPILIDTGLHPSCVSDVTANMGRMGRVPYLIRMNHDQALRVQLPARGIQPSEVRVVIMTHLHVDRASAVSEFPNAMFVVDRREWASAAQGGARRGYHPRQFDHAFDWRALDYGSDPVESFAGFAQTFDLFGDGSLRTISTPGHTLGHQSVVLRTGSGEVLVAGDAASTERSLLGDAEPLRAHDEHLYRRSLREIQRYREQTPDAVVITGHDPDAWPSLKPVYE